MRQKNRKIQVHGQDLWILITNFCCSFHNACPLSLCSCVFCSLVCLSQILMFTCSLDRNQHKLLALPQAIAAFQVNRFVRTQKLSIDLDSKSKFFIHVDFFHRTMSSTCKKKLPQHTACYGHLCQ